MKTITEHNWEEELKTVNDCTGTNKHQDVCCGCEEIVIATKDEINSLITSVKEEEREKLMELISTHTEHDGGYCDTGEDMDWSCRSECVDLAIKRIQSLTKEDVPVEGVPERKHSTGEDVTNSK
jgi:hypothetical protein